MSIVKARLIEIHSRSRFAVSTDRQKDRRKDRPSNKPTDKMKDGPGTDIEKMYGWTAEMRLYMKGRWEAAINQRAQRRNFVRFYR